MGKGKKPSKKTAAPRTASQRNTEKRSSAVTNSQKYREQQRNKMRERAANKAIENNRRYQHTGSGTSVIQRSNTDLRNMPAMRGEPIHRGGFHSTYPVAGGHYGNAIDRKQALDMAILKGHTSANINKMLINAATTSPYIWSDKDISSYVNQLVGLRREEKHNEMLKTFHDVQEKKNEIINSKHVMKNRILELIPEKERPNAAVVLERPDALARMTVEFTEMNKERARRLNALEELNKLSRDNLDKKLRIDSMAAHLKIKPTDEKEGLRTIDIITELERQQIDARKFEKAYEQLLEIDRLKRENSDKLYQIRAAAGELHAKDERFNEICMSKSILRNPISEDHLAAGKLAEIFEDKKLDIDKLTAECETAVNNEKVALEEIHKRMINARNGVKKSIDIINDYSRELDNTAGYAYDLLADSGLVQREELQEISRTDLANILPIMER